jgi:hypothetical protein
MKDELMTRDEGFRLVTRALAFVCLLWFIDNLLFLPVDAVAVFHHLQRLHLARETGRFVEDETYWTRYYAAWTCMRAVGMAIALWFALWLCRGGNAVRKFFLSDES